MRIEVVPETPDLNRTKPLAARHFRLPGSSRTGKNLVLLVAVAACACTVHYWLGHFCDIYTDSACYINAADNLVKSGRLVDYGNWISLNPGPVAEPYTEWPPGTPLFLLPFILIFHDPMLSTIVAQSLLIVLVYVVLVAFASLLDLDAVLTAALLVVFAFFQPFVSSVSQYASETLFYITSLMAGYYAVKIVRDGPSKKYWIMSLLFAFLASSVRFSGVANIGWYIPILGPAIILKKSPDDRVTKLIRRIILIVSLMLLVGSVWLDEKISFERNRILVIHIILLVLGCVAFILGLGLLPAIDRKPAVSRETQPRGWVYNTNFLRFLVAAAAFAPVVMWFARNEIMYGVITESHRLFSIFSTQGIVEAPQMLCLYMLRNPFIPQTVSFFVMTLLALIPLVMGERKERIVGSILVCATLFQIGTMWISSIFAKFAYLDQRLLSPAILLAAVTVLYGLGILYRANAKNKSRFLLLLLPFLFLATNKHMDFEIPDLLSWKVNYPKEMHLWQQIHRMKWTLTSSQVYTEPDYRHQLFAGIPQKIYWNTDILRNPVLLNKLFSEGHRPFLVFPEKSREDEMIRRTIARYAFRVDSVAYPDPGYVVYFETPPGGKSAEVKEKTVLHQRR